VSCKCRCFNCNAPDRHKQTNKQTKNLSESLPGEEIVIDMVQTGKFFQGQSNPMLVHLEEQEQA
jgi:hypothetical protein